MILRLRTKKLRFAYTFECGYRLVGRVEGDYFPNSPNIVFNLRSLQAVCISPQGNPLITFDDVFGQLSLDTSEAILSGSESNRQFHQRSFFSFNHRNHEASIYDATTDTWITAGWHPDRWQVEELVPTKPKIPQSPIGDSIWMKRAIA